MRYTVQLPTHRVDLGEEFTSGAALAEMARAAEEAGFDACFVTDHPFPGDRWLEGGGHHTLDPFVALSFAAAATTRIRLQTHVLVLPYRNPFVVAKAAASLDVASGGRLILGTAAGYLKSEFAAVGADFDERNRFADEALDAIRLAWTTDGVAFEGMGFRARGNTMLPQPLQKPHPPLWVGGNSRRAIRRAVERGDGWVPFPNTAEFASRQRTAVLDSVEALRQRLDYARQHAASIGRESAMDVCFAPIGADMNTRHGADPVRVQETVASLADLGVTWLALSPPVKTRSRWCSAVGELGKSLVR